MAGGRPRKPTNVLEASGAFAKNPSRRRDRANEPISVEPAGKAPEHLTQGQANIWDEIIDQAPPGVITKADRIQLEVAVMALDQLRNGTIVVDDQVIKLDGPMYQREPMGTLQKALSSLGMTPVDRSKVEVPKPKTDDPFAEF